MRSRVYLLALVCALLAFGLVGWKVKVLGYSLLPSPSEAHWNVQLTARGTGTGGSVRLLLALPDSEPGGRGTEQRLQSSGLELSGLRPRGATRYASFQSASTGEGSPVSATYRFQVQARPDAPPPVSTEDTRPSSTLPSDDPALLAQARELTHTAPTPLARVRALYDFVLDEIAPASGGTPSTSDSAALDVLSTRQGTATGRIRLFVALARAVEIPARVVRALALSEGAERSLLVRAEVFLDGEWVPVDPVRGRFGADAAEGLVLLRGSDALVRAEGLSSLRLAASATRGGLNELKQQERRALNERSFIDALSLSRLPPRLQLVFRVLLLIPLGALVVSVFRNVIGTPTFGTFMPILIALALRETRPLVGLGLLAIVVAVGIAGRRFLSGLRLLVVPRLSLLLTFVIFTVGALALLSLELGLGDGFDAALLPLVILTMSIERVGILIEEEGIRSALRTTAGTVLVAAAGYLLLQNDTLQRLVFDFPELNLLVVAGLLLVGRYTGYRLTELMRFRPLVEEEDPADEKSAA